METRDKRLIYDLAMGLAEMMQAVGTDGVTQHRIRMGHLEKADQLFHSVYQEIEKAELKENRKPIRNWFSNMLPFDVPLVEDGIEYRTPEHYYQAQRAESWEAKFLIASQKNGTRAKNLAQRLPETTYFMANRLAIMTKAQEYRFGKGTVWEQRLLDYEHKIVEVNNWHDNFWGNCICSECSNITGKNWLGIILMEIRGKKLVK